MAETFSTHPPARPKVEIMKPKPPRRQLTNDRYVIRLGTTNFTERYYRDRAGWVKISARGRKFRLTAEQVLNHLLPAFAGIKPNLIIQVEYTAAAAKD